MPLGASRVKAVKWFKGCIPEETPEVLSPGNSNLVLGCRLTASRARSFIVSLLPLSFLCCHVEQETISSGSGSARSESLGPLAGAGSVVVSYGQRIGETMKPVQATTHTLVSLLTALAVGLAPGCSRNSRSVERGQAKPPGEQRLESLLEQLRPLHRKLDGPEPGEWLYEHEEKGQTFAQYVSSEPVIPDDSRSIIYIQPLGEFSETQERILELTRQFLSIYFSLPVKTLPGLGLKDVPEHAVRVNPDWGMKQLLSKYLLDDVLLPGLPQDAVSLIGITATDLWPGEGWNFVFGQAYLRKRTGVWSIYRFGDPDLRELDFRLCLRRTIATGSHELGHMLGMSHCTAYECNMGGSNSMEESDEGPLALCPECLAKLCWATGSDPVERFRKLEAFAREYGFVAEADFYKASLEALLGKGGKP